MMITDTAHMCKTRKPVIEICHTQKRVKKWGLSMKKRIFTLILCVLLLFGEAGMSMTAYAKGTTYTQLEDVYYSLAGCKVYSEPTYNSVVLTELEANIPVRVVGYYSNGWYRINIGVIAYCKMDSLTTSGDIGIVNISDSQAYYAKQTADELGYDFHYLKLNQTKTIKKDVFNSYIGKKVILFAKIDDEVAVSFKMLYADKVKTDINLNFTKIVSESDGARTIELVAESEAQLPGQVAIFQIKVGYDKAAEMYIWSINDSEYNLMNTYYTEFSEYAYASVTQVSNMKIVEMEVPFSLTDKLREKTSNIRKGIKYLDYDEKEYRSSIGSRLRKDTEYMDYNY